MSALLILAVCLTPGRVTAGRGGVAATAHPLATDAATEMLEKGGNAVDAAVAAAFAIGVVEPDGSGLGGGGGMLVFLQRTGETIYINYYHEAPGDPGAIDFDPATDRNTAKSVLVPGTTAGLCLALERYGTLPLPVVIEPALRYARDGFPVDATLAGILLDSMESLAKRPELAEIFLTDGFPKMEGEILVQPQLAHVLQLISEQGRDGFYKGETARALVDGLVARGGTMTMEDLAQVEPYFSAPVRGTYRGCEIVSAPSPHSGTTLIEILNMLEFVDFDPQVHFSRSAPNIHMMAEIFRRAYADRSQYLGDPRFTDAPIAGLQSKSYARDVFAGINRYRAEPRNYRDTPYGLPAKYAVDADAGVRRPAARRGPVWSDDRDADPGLLRRDGRDPFDRWNRSGRSRPDTAATASAPVQRRRAMDEEFDGGHTTHLSVIDSDGNMVALTQTLGNFFGAKVMINGILLNNGRVNFSAMSSANMIAPHKRPRSSLSPTLVFRQGEPFMSLGSPGAGRIIATVAQVLVNVIDYGMDVQAANDAPRIFCQKFDDHLSVESRVAPGVPEQLERMGHSVRVLGALDLFFGGVQITAVDPGTGKMVGAADPRRGGSAQSLDPEDEGER